MGGSIERGLNALNEHYVAVCIFLALFILTWVGVGDVATVSALGLLLCAAGLAQRSARVDLWVLLPLAVYQLASMASSLAAYGNIVDGFASTQLVFPVIYLLMACLEGGELRGLRRACTAWTGAAALAGIVRFAWRAAVQGSAARLGGFLGNPNAMGIFLVLGWFALIRCGGEEDGRWSSLSPCIEPVLLAALALTLSMGSFAAMAAGVLWLLIAEKSRTSWGETLRAACRLLARASLGVGTGFLAYLAASRTGVRWLCPLAAVYVLVLALCWKKFCAFLEARPGMAALIAGMGLVVAAGAVAVRPSALATFAERLEMMGSALTYLPVSPLVGVGPYRWRLLDMTDGGTYFNTWHIHNALLHVGVELGWTAMVMLVLVVVRCFRKKAHPAAKAEFAAFCVHNLMDTSFFYLVVPALVMMTAGSPGEGGKQLSGGLLKLLFGLSAAAFAWGLFCAVRAG